MKSRSLRAAVLLVLLSWIPAAWPQETTPKYSKITLAALVDVPSLQWKERQTVQADSEGRVFLLRDKTFELFQISSGGSLVPKGRLLRDSASLETPPIHDVSMSRAGDAWMLFAFPNRLFMFQGGGVNKLEAPWIVSAAILDGGEPLVAVLPGEMNTTAPSILRLDKLPFLQQWDGKRWSTLAERDFPGNPPEGVERHEYWEGEYKVFLALTPERRLWVADQYAYRLRRFSPSKRIEDELLVGGGKVKWSERTEEEWAKAEAAAKRGGLASWSRSQLSSVRAEQVVRGMTVGRDGAVYLLVQTPEGLALDRFHPALLSLDRALLPAGMNPGSGRVSMAAGSQGLYIAGWAGHEGLWVIDATTLDSADWRPVPEALLNGQPLDFPKEKATSSDSSPKKPRPQKAPSGVKRPS
jgi:hypothetical protein